MNSFIFKLEHAIIKFNHYWIIQFQDKCVSYFRCLEKADVNPGIAVPMLDTLKKKMEEN